MKTTRLKASAIPKDWPVKPLGAKDNPRGKATCGTCGLSWDDDKVTSMTPAPSARCPFEQFHVEEEDEEATEGSEGLGWLFKTLRGEIDDGQTCEASQTVDEIDEIVKGLRDACRGLLAQVTGPAMVYGDGRGNDGKKTGLSHQEFNTLRNNRIAKAREQIARAEGRG